MAEVVVVGSLSMDLTARVARRPALGETVIGTGFGMVPGGKGNNQALTCARQGVRTALVGRVGDDAFADQVIAAALAAGVDTTYVIRDPAHPTGIAHITVDEQGGNAIVVVPLANAALDPADVRAAAGAFAGARVVLTQLEVPLEAARAALAMGRRSGATTVLNPAPARELDGGLLRLVDVLVPNEVEAAALTGRQVADVDGAVAAGETLRARGCREVVVTLGAQGAVRVAADGRTHLPAFAVSAVDTVAAGDAFCGALAAALATGASRAVALRRASAAGALATTRAGASSSLPSAAAVDQLLRSAPGGVAGRAGP